MPEAPAVAERAASLVTPLAWDSAHFGFPVARVEAGVDRPELLSLAIERARALGVTLLYLFLDERAAPALGAHAGALGGALVDRKVTYLQAVRATARPPLADGVAIAPWTGGWPDAALRRLALASGEYSRFRCDPRMPAHVFPLLYETWMGGAVAGELADVVLVARVDGELAGVVTVGRKQGRSDVGLLAVAPEARGRGVGRALVHAALDDAARRGHAHAQVVTQGANEAACRLYEACGYAVDRVEHVHHFWLGNPHDA